MYNLIPYCNGVEWFRSNKSDPLMKFYGFLGSLISLVSSNFTNQKRDGGFELSIGNFHWMMTTHSVLKLNMKIMK